MRRTFYAPPRLHAYYSLLGRILRRRVRDSRQAEAYILIALASLAVVLILAQFFTWTWLQAYPSWAWAIWIGEVALYAGLCLLGFAPAIHVTTTPSHVELRQGRRMRALRYSEIVGCASVSALRYHREYRPYAHVQPFMNRMTPRVLVVRTPAAVVAVGLPPGDLDALGAIISERQRVTELDEAVIAPGG